ncbi:hypothetical protein ES705_50659 [subsurface metagenome]
MLAVNLDGLVWDAGTKRLTRNDGGSFILDGFIAGDKILIQNSNLNSGLLTIKSVSITRSDIAFVDGGVGLEDTITTVAGDFVAAGFAEGDIITVSGSTDNNGTYTLTGVAVGTLTVATDLLTAEGVGDVVIISSGLTALVLTFDVGDTIVLDTEDNNVVISHFRELWIGNNLINGNNYEVDNNHIYYPGSFPIGHKNVRMTYYAGYSSSNMPEELKLAVKIIIKSIYQKKEEEIFGVEKYMIGDINITREDNDMPREALAILSKYRRIVI